MDILWLILFFVVYFTICILAENAYDSMCIDFLDYFIENETDENKHKKVSKFIGG